MIREEDYAFSVEVLGSQWDVYRFEKDGKKGMLAFRQTAPKSPENPRGKWEIGMFTAGELTPEQVAEKLRQGKN